VLAYRTIREKGPQQMNNKPLQWHICVFSELTTDRLYDILQLRGDVFAVEQNSVYTDADGLDKVATHLWASQDDTILSYCRVLPPGTRFEAPSIGRVCTRKESRGHGLARKMMLKAIAQTERLYPAAAITVSSQEYLSAFYATLGFVCVSDVYGEDGIPHIEMLKQPS
jgi:ElaA protein